MQIITNNNNGAVYDEAEVFTYRELAISTFALGNSAQPNIDGMVNNEWNLGYDTTAGGDIDNGWTITSTTDGALQLTNNGFIPNVTYDVWDTNVSSDTARIIASPSYSLFEQNATSGYQSFDLTDLNSPTWVGFQDKDAFVASGATAASLINHPSYIGDYTASDLSIDPGFVGTSADGFSTWQAPSDQYLLFTAADFNPVPEPASTTLFALAALGLTARRKRSHPGQYASLR